MGEAFSHAKLRTTISTMPIHYHTVPRMCPWKRLTKLCWVWEVKVKRGHEQVTLDINQQKPYRCSISWGDPMWLRCTNKMWKLVSVCFNSVLDQQTLLSWLCTLIQLQNIINILIQTTNTSRTQFIRSRSQFIANPFLALVNCHKIQHSDPNSINK